MARQTQTAEFNSFVKGLITEASALTFPENASLDEDNFVLRRDGSRDRRLGMDYEQSAEIINTGIASTPTGEAAFSSYSWDNAGGTPNKRVIVVQTGNIVKFFDVDTTPLSSGEIYSYTFLSASEDQIFSYADVDGFLVIATGQKKVQVFEYDSGSISRSERVLKIRDLFGVEDTAGGQDLTEGSGLVVRPSTLTQAHTYNLRNQSFAAPRIAGGDGNFLRDPIEHFEIKDGNYPSNSDNVNLNLYPNPASSSNPTGDQFYAKDLSDNPPGSFPSAKGYFIIDALDRGASRLEEINNLYSEYPELGFSVSSLPTDSTSGGPTAVEEYAGRVWYAGFSGTTTGADDKSPKMASYVLYSQLVEDPSDIIKCYQEGDPTAKENPDLVDTDGGFVRIDGAYNVQRLVNVGSRLVVIAENGIWAISGGSDYGFSATNNKVTKLTDRGCDSPGSVVVVDNTVFFWAEDAIYQIGPDQFGDYSAQNITQTTIQSFYNDIPAVDKVYAQGAYDSYDRKVRWVYNNRLQDTQPPKELILDVTLGAFYTSTVGQIDGELVPRIVSPVVVSPFRLSEQDAEVVYGTDQVLYGTDQVVKNVEIRGASSREIAYVTLTSLDPIKYTFSTYRDSSFKDWVSVDGVGVDAPAYLVTGYFSGGDHLRYKQVPYVQFFLTRTEDGFEDDGTGNWVPTNQSSCLVQAQWEWANSANSNRWGRTFQAYRYRRLYSPSSVSDSFDNGFEVITTKNKLRGKGKVLSLKISTEEGKDLRLLGWAMVVGANGNV